jgi:hypothetical protein
MTKTLETSATFRAFIEETKGENKVSNFLYKYMNRGYYYSAKHCALLERNITGETINYLTFRKDGTLSYLPKGKELTYNERGEWSREGRQEAKPARAIQQVFSPAALRLFSKRDLEIFSNLYKGRATDYYTIKTATGKDIYNIYNQRTGAFSSCMAGASEEKLLIYTQNTNVRLLYVESNGEIKSRALCWTDKDGAQIIDRVYGNELFSQLFRDYAREIGAYKKSSDTAGESMFISPTGENVHMNFKIPVDVTGCSLYPYIDTFPYLNKSQGWLSNDEEGAEFECNCTGGHPEDLRGVRVYGRDGFYHREDVVWSDYYSDHIHEDDAVECNGNYYYDGDLTRISAFQRGRRWVAVDDCEEVECFNADDYHGIATLEELDTFKMYRDDDGRLYDLEDALECWQHDNGEIIGEVE